MFYALMDVGMSSQGKAMGLKVWLITFLTMFDALMGVGVSSQGEAIAPME